jgi:hypothetical protein
MAWDPAVLRKYNTTGHFRLLNQVRSELKANPIERSPEGGTTRTASGLVRPSVSRARDLRGDGGRRRGGGAGGGLSLSASPASPASALDHGSDGVASGVRSRLSAIRLG